MEGSISETAISLNDLLKTGTLKVLVDKAHGWVKKALNCYATPIKVEEKFIIMMLLDACFIVEFFILKVDYCHQNCGFNLIKGNVDFSFYDGIEEDITDDMIKLENQVPFFLLENLFEEIPKNNVPIRSKFRDEKKIPISFRDDENVPISFKDLAHWALKSGLVRECEIDWNKEPDHLVDFLICFFVPFPAKNMQNNMNNNCSSFLGHIPFSGCWQKLDEENNDQTRTNDCLTLFKPLCHLWNKIACKEKKREIGSSNIPPSITELSEAGVSIKKAENSKYMRNITFKKGVLKIPPLHIYDNFELMLRNMVAFEQYTAGNKDKYVTQYVLFLDNLISTEKDVHLLVKAGVIINNIGGSDKEVSDLFNNLGKFVTQSSSPHYDSISKALREHCNGCWNKAKASLKHNYFNTPWAFISFFAATFLILLTMLQTIFSAISTFPKQPTA